MKMPTVEVKTEYTRFRGGEDLESPVLSIDPGALMFGLNYMCGSEGGYSRIDGYERFSGKTSPSDAVYYYAPCTFTAGGPAVGNTVTGSVTGSTGVVITVGTNYINITKRSAAFNADEGFKVGGVTKGTFTGAMAASGETTAILNATAQNAAADVYRADIAKPAGTYAIRGLALLKGVLYAFVDNAGGTAGEIYKQSAAGWVNVPLFSQISFDTGQAAGIAEGATITQDSSGATALVKRVVLESGTWAGGDAAGRLIITTITGTFDATNVVKIGGTTRATSTSLATAITITVGGRYEFVVHNFTGSTDTQRIYGCDGVNYGFEFDGTTYVPIHTGMVSDKPQYVSAFKEHLFFSFRGSSQHSGPGTPYVWTVVLGAGEIAIGDDVTGYLVEAQTLLICSRNSTHALTGASADDWVLNPLNAEIGAIPRTCQSIAKAHCLDDRGLIQITRSQDFGNFNFGTVSQKVQKIIKAMQKVVVASAVMRDINQYRLYGSDKTGIVVTLGLGQNGLEYYFSQFLYPDAVACTVSGEDSSGKDVVFFGSTAGMVYQGGKGSSFDGEAIEAYAWMPFNNSKSPTTLKTYRKVTIAMTSEGYAPLRFNVDFSYGNPDIQSHTPIDLTLQGSGGYWDLSNWDEFNYDTEVVSSPSFTVSGDGVNASLMVYSNTDLDLGHRLDGAIIHYTPRRLVR